MIRETAAADSLSEPAHPGSMDVIEPVVRYREFSLETIH